MFFEIIFQIYSWKNTIFASNKLIKQTTMNKLFTLFSVLLLALAMPIKAQLLLEENFDYAAGDLVGKGGWTRYGTTSQNPVQVTDNTLSYEGYATNKGKAIELKSLSTTDEDVAVKFTPGDDESITSGNIYYSMLINVKSVDDALSNDGYVAALIQRRVNSSSAFPNNGDAFGKLFIKKSGEGKFKFGLNRKTDTASHQIYTTTEYNINTTYLVVVKYAINGTNEEIEQTDIISLYVNPVTTDAEPATPTLVYDNSTNTSNNDFRVNPTAYTATYGLWGLQLMQNKKGSANFPNVLVGNVRVALKWASLMKQSGGDDPQPSTPTIQTDKAQGVSLVSDYGFAVKGKQYTAIINVKGSNLNGDITIDGPASNDISLSTTTISKANAESLSGYNLIVTLTPNDEGMHNDQLVLKSDEANSVTVPIVWFTLAPTEVTQLTNITEQEDYTTIYKVAGPLIVTHRQGNNIYVQGTTSGGGIIIDEEGMLADVAEGTSLMDITGFGYNAGLTGYNLRVGKDITIYTTNDSYQADIASLTLAQLNASGASLHNQLVAVDNVTFGHLNGTEFTPLEENEMFTTGHQVHIKDSEGTTALVRLFAGTDLIGTKIPETAKIIGLSTSASGTVIAPRGKADIIPVEQSDPQPTTASLLQNGSFETWQNGAFGMVIPEGWETTLGECSKEESQTLDGQYALRLKAGSTSTAGKLRQEVKPNAESTEAFVKGEKYEMIINYKVVTEATEGNTIELNSFWRSSEGELSHESDILANGEGLTYNVGEWQTKTVVTTVPDNANSFYFSLKMGKKAEVIFDKFSFHRYTSGDPELLIEKKSLAFNTTLGTPQTKTLVVKTANIEATTQLEVTGANSDQFQVTPSTIEPGTKSVIVSVTYNPTVASNTHQATLLIDPQTPGLSGMVSLTGANYDPNATPTITANPMELEFEAEVGKSQDKTITITSENIGDYFVTAKVADLESGQFQLSNGALPKNTETTLTVTFKPTQEGTHTQQVILSAEGAQSVIINLTGVATQNTDHEKEGDSWPLSAENPLKLMIEHFDNVEANNKPLSIEGWKNIAEEGNRAWWGYNLDGDKVAKVTAYYYAVSERSKAEQWLITPALDFKNAENKLFTFRVRGDYMPEEGLEDQLDLCLMYFDPMGELQAEIINAGIPTVADHNEEWMEIHLNFNGDQYADIMPDVFFMGFRFYTENAGSNSSVVYYLDDVTWGRTDIPTLTPSIQTIAEENLLGTIWTSSPISVSAINLTEPITLSLGGPTASQFELSTETLPATGGEFTVKMKAANDEAVYGAYVKISSRGAADVYVAIAINNTTVVGIKDVEKTSANSEVFDLQGRRLNSVSKPGIYIIDGKKKMVR